MKISKCIAFSGAPGGGKTAVAESLLGFGYSVVPESARPCIAERNAKGLSPRPSPLEFAQTLIEKDIEQYESVMAMASYTFFDRTVLDSLCMLDIQDNLSIEKRAEILKCYRYNPTAFFFPPWKEIYCMDSERDQSFEEAVSIYDLLKNWYSECGYRIVIVAPATVNQRCISILQTLGIRN